MNVYTYMYVFSYCDSCFLLLLLPLDLCVPQKVKKLQKLLEKGDEMVQEER